jgi:hypothetical protein
MLRRLMGRRLGIRPADWWRTAGTFPSCGCALPACPPDSLPAREMRRPQRYPHPCAAVASFSSVRFNGPMRRHHRLGDLIGRGLLLGSDERITVNRVGDDVQLVRMGADFRAQAEIVPPDDRDDITGWIRTAERMWDLRNLEWRFESVRDAWTAWQQRPPGDTSARS